MTYLLELTIMKIYWDHKFAESLWSVTRTEQTINQLRIDKVSLELMHGKQRAPSEICWQDLNESSRSNYVV